MSSSRECSNELSSDPLVSIVTPAYNEEAFLPHNLESVQAQSYDSIEHVVVDDGSTDGTADVLEAFDSESLRWISQSNQGLPKAVNRGFELADGEIVIWLNGDDVLFTPSTVETVIDAFRRTEADFLYGSYAVIDTENRIQSVRVPHPWFSAARLRRLCFGAFVFMRGHVTEAHKLDTRYQHTPDYEYYLRAAENGYEFEFVDEVLFGHRRYADTKTIAYGDEMSAESNQCQRAYGQEFDTRYRIGRAVDLGIERVLRLWGGYQLLRRHFEDEQFAFDVPAEPIGAPLKRQARSLIPSSLG